MKLRRILLLTNTYESPYAGTEGQIRALVENLPDSWEAELWTLVPKRIVPREDMPFDVRCLEIPRLRRIRTLARLPALRSEVRRRFDVIHTFMADAGVLGCVLGRLARKPVFVSRRDLGIWHTPGRLRATRFFNRFATGFVANCEAVREATIQTEHLDPERIRVIHNGLDPARFERNTAFDVRARLDIPPEAPLLCMVGNYREIKRHADLIDALAILNNEVPGLHLLLVGFGLDPAVAHARRRGVDSRVRTLMLKEDVVPTLRHVDIGVLCSDSEGLSNAVLEYLGCGLPVVASNVGGNPELVADGENGFLFEPGDVRGLATELARLLRDAELRRSFGEASRKRFAGRYTVERMVRETVAMYEGR